MLQKLAYVIIILVGCYILYQIPFIQNSADAIYNSFIEKRDNVTAEYERVKGKVDEATGKVIEVKEDVEDTVETVSNTVDAIGDATDKIGDLVGDDEEESEAEVITCTEEQKAAEMCTMDYTPVCGDDGVTYGNACMACASGNIGTYTAGECAEEEEPVEE